MLPTFLVIGSQKAGTTSIYNVLKKHPQIFMPETKEINFFFHEYLYSRGIEFYELYFNSEKSDVIGEASPGYICHPEAPRRIKKHLPNVKLILTVRNPIDRAYSQYYDNRRQLSETRPFHQTLFTALSDEYSPGECGYFSRGIYIKYIKRYLEYFHHDQLFGQIPFICSFFGTQSIVPIFLYLFAASCGLAREFPSKKGLLTKQQK